MGRFVKFTDAPAPAKRRILARPKQLHVRQKQKSFYDNGTGGFAMPRRLDQGQITVGGASDAYDLEVERIFNHMILTSVTGKAIAFKIKGGLSVSMKRR